MKIDYKVSNESLVMQRRSLDKCDSAVIGWNSCCIKGETLDALETQFGIVILEEAL